MLCSWIASTVRVAASWQSSTLSFGLKSLHAHFAVCVISHTCRSAGYRTTARGQPTGPTFAAAVGNVPTATLSTLQSSARHARSPFPKNATGHSLTRARAALPVGRHSPPIQRPGHATRWAGSAVGSQSCARTFAQRALCNPCASMREYVTQPAVTLAQQHLFA